MSLLNDLHISRKPLAGFLAIGFAWATYFAQMPVIKAQVGASDGAYGIAVLFSAFGALAAMWLAPACQKFMGRWAMPVGIVAVGCGMMSAGLSTQILMLTLSMLLAALGSGVVDVLINARTADIEQSSGRKLMNLNHALYAFAYGAGALATGVFRTAELSPGQIFSILLLLLLLLAWMSFDNSIILEDAHKDKEIRFPINLVVMAGVVILAAFLTEASTEGWSALHLERTLGGSPAEGAMGPALLGITMGIGRLAGHGLSKRFRDTSLMLIATLIATFGTVLAALAPDVMTAWIGFAIAGLGISIVVPLAMALVGRVVPPEARLAAISRATVIGYGAFFFGPPLMGLVAEMFGLRAAFLLIACLLAMVAVTLIPALARRLG